jgi:hypothetical protein
VSSADGIDYIFSGLPVAFFNVAVLTQPSISASALRAFGHAAARMGGGDAGPVVLRGDA